METERDQLSEVYNRYANDAATQARWAQSNPGNQAALRERMLVAGELLEQWRPMGDRRDALDILDLGCGHSSLVAPSLDGAEHRWIGADLLFDRVAGARDRSPRATPFHGLVCADGAQLPLGGKSFDLVLLFTVLSSVPSDETCARIGAEVSRVLRDDGALLVYDFRYRNRRNQATRPMPGAKIEQFFPGFDAQWRTVTLLPPLARRLGPATAVGYRALGTIAPLRSHVLGLLTARRGRATS